MREKIDQLTEAKARGIITAEEYAGAIKKVKEAQEDQQASQDQMKTGLDAIAAGFMNAMNKAGRANKEYEAGEKIFDSMVSGFGDAIEQLVTTGTIKFDELAKSFASMLARMAAELAARAVIMSILKAIAGGAGAGDVTAASPTATMQAYNTSAMDFKLPGFAAGGPVSAGQAIMVGENGPERFVPSVAGRIEPNSSLSREPSITINNNAPGVDVKAERGSEGDLLFTIEKVRAALTRDVRRGGNPFSVAMGQAYGMARAGR
jgi:phage-related minor tail protein